MMMMMIEYDIHKKIKLQALNYYLFTNDHVHEHC